MCLDVLLEILGPLEGLAAELALVGLERNMNANVRSDVVTLDSGGAAGVPLASEIQVVCALAANMAFADVFVEDLRCRKLLVAVAPAASQRFLGGC
jgi:hypothetical protein